MLIKPTSLLVPVAVLALTACAAKDTRTAGTTVTTVPSSTGGQQVVMVEPGAAVRGEVRHSLVGKVDSVNRNAGEVTVKALDGSKMTVKVPPMAAATIREGDEVTMNMVVKPR